LYENNKKKKRNIILKDCQEEDSLTFQENKIKMNENKSKGKFSLNRNEGKKVIAFHPTFGNFTMNQARGLMTFMKMLSTFSIFIIFLCFFLYHCLVLWML
jgi:hypothetical protein